MAKSLYVGVNNAARKVSAGWIGVNGVARKIKAGYIGVNGIARQFYESKSPPVLSYTGVYTTREVEWGGKRFLEYSFTTSGTLSLVSGSITGKCYYWGIGGGASGRGGSSGNGWAGSGGFSSGDTSINDAGFTFTGSYAITIGAGGTGTTSAMSGNAGSDTKFGAITIKGAPASTNNWSTTGQSAGTGGGGKDSTTSRTIKGDGKTKVPFGDTVNHSLVGGGGGEGSYSYYPSSSGTTGGSGGTNGGPGTTLYTSGSLGLSPGNGGAGGGGRGGTSSSSFGGSGLSATLPGAGGGTGGYSYGDGSATYGGNGYRGGLWIRIPI